MPKPYQLYILKDQTPEPENDTVKWAAWFETANRRLAEDVIGNQSRVSTIFLGIDHNLYRVGGPPILFETMVFGGPLDCMQWRYSTWADAIAGHERACKWVKLGIALNRQM